jgi:hypothetical protein
MLISMQISQLASIILCQRFAVDLDVCIVVAPLVPFIPGPYPLHDDREEIGQYLY